MSKVKKQLIEELEDELCYNEYEPSEEEMNQAKIQDTRDDDYEFIDEDLPEDDYITF